MKQGVLINLLLRNYLLYRQYGEAECFRSKAIVSLDSYSINQVLDAHYMSKLSSTRYWFICFNESDSKHQVRHDDASIAACEFIPDF